MGAQKPGTKPIRLAGNSRLALETARQQNSMALAKQKQTSSQMSAQKASTSPRIVPMPADELRAREAANPDTYFDSHKYNQMRNNY